MEKSNNKRKTLRFLMTEIALGILGLITVTITVYKAIGLVILSIAALVALYRLLSVYSRRDKKKAKIFKIVLTALLCLGLVYFTVVEIPIIGSAHTDKNPEAPYLIVLGAGVDGTVPSVSLTNRLEAAQQYLDEFPETIAIVSGAQGPGENISEAECMRRYLEKNGISPDRIIMETEAVSTYDNIKNSLEKILENGGDPTGKVAIVSSEYHLYRAKYMARECNADALGVSAHTTYPVLMVNYFIREAFAVTALWIM